MWCERGQAAILLIGGLAAVLIGAFVFAAVGRGMTREGDLQRAAGLAALAGARAMYDTFTRLFEPVMLDHRPTPGTSTRTPTSRWGARLRPTPPRQRLRRCDGPVPRPRLVRPRAHRGRRQPPALLLARKPQGSSWCIGLGAALRSCGAGPRSRRGW